MASVQATLLPSCFKESKRTNPQICHRSVCLAPTGSASAHLRPALTPHEDTVGDGTTAYTQLDASHELAGLSGQHG